VTLARDPVSTSSQDARIETSADDTVEDLGGKVYDALVLVRDDIQRLAGQVTKSVTANLGSGNHRLTATLPGIARVFAISDTATAGSTGANYHTLSLLRNGLAPITLTYDTRRVEVPKYLGGCYLGEIPVTSGDILALNLVVTGAPAPTLTTANFCLLCTVRGS